MSVHRLSSGKWKVRYRSGGSQRSRSFAEKRDALMFERQVVREKDTRGLVLVDRGMVSLDEFLVGWWDQKRDDWSENTRNQYRHLYGAHVHRQLGRMPLRELTPGVLDTWKRERLSNGVPGPSLKKTMTMLSGLFRFAVLHGELEYNPLREVEKPKSSRKLAPDPFSISEVERIRACLKPRDAVFVSVLAYMGLRPGEALRLQWEDVNERTVRVRDTKRERERPGLLLPPLAQDLKEWQLLSGVREGNVFTGLDLHSWRSKTWRPALVSVFGSLPADPRPYRLRSSFVSLLLADPKYSIAETALYAGHSVAVMGTYYAGLVAEYQGRQVDAEYEIRKFRNERKVA